MCYWSEIGTLYMHLVMRVLLLYIMLILFYIVILLYFIYTGEVILISSIFEQLILYFSSNDNYDDDAELLNA